MKRSGIRRYTRLKTYKGMPPSTKPLKRSRINRISKDERKRINARTPLRNKYKREHPVCQCERDCGGVACQLHEMAAGAQFRWKSAALPSCWLHLTERCHRRLQGVNYVVQLGCKLFHDPENYDHAEFHEVIGRTPTAHPIAEVVAAMPRKPPSTEDCKITLDNWKRKVADLERLLAAARVGEFNATIEYGKAQAREQKIEDARKLEA